MIRPELLKVLTNKRTVLTSIFIAVFWNLMYLPSALSVSPEEMPAILASTGIYVASMTGLFIAMMYSNEVFLSEKRERTIETLLCSPLTMKQIWLAKTLAAGSLSAIVAATSMVVMHIGTSVIAGRTILPSMNVLTYMLIVLPVFFFSVVSVFGLVQLMMGMKESRILNMVFMFMIFGGLGLTRSLIGIQYLSWMNIGIFLAVASSVLAATQYLTRFLSKEKIVTSIS